MFIGVNTNIKHKDEIFHIQTEDGGLDQHTLTTILFKNGAILSSRKTSYIDIPKSPTYEETVREMMQEQHKQMMRDLVSGKFENVTETAEDDKKDDPETEQGHEQNDLPKETSTPEKAKEQIMPPEEEQQDPAPANRLDVLISDYLAKKDAARV